jgi:integrase
MHCYNSYTKNYFIPYLGDQIVGEINHHVVQNFKKRLPDTIKLKTKRNIINALHAFLAWAQINDYIVEIPPFPLIKGNDSTPQVAITIEQQNDGLSKIPEIHRDIFILGFECGTRPGESCSMQARDYNAAFKAIMVQRTFTMGGKLKENTKANKKKLIPLSNRALKIINKHVDGKSGEDFIFINPDTNRHYTVKALNQIWRKYSGVNCTHYEASRHSFATQLVEACEDVSAAQALLRHADLRSTMHYVHARLERLRHISNKRTKTNVIEINAKRKREAS